MDNLDYATRYLERAVMYDLKMAGALHNWAVYEKAKKLNMAIQAYKKANSLLLRKVTIISYWAVSISNSGNGCSTAGLIKSLRYNKNQPEAEWYLGQIYMLDGKYKDGIEHIETAINLTEMN
jgi:tetratricopeptide (TPR) repeat protein